MQGFGSSGNTGGLILPRKITPGFRKDWPARCPAFFVAPAQCRASDKNIGAGSFGKKQQTVKALWSVKRHCALGCSNDRIMTWHGQNNSYLTPRHRSLTLYPPYQPVLACHERNFQKPLKSRSKTA